MLSTLTIERLTSYRPWARGYAPVVGLVDSEGETTGSAIEIVRFSGETAQVTYYWPRGTYLALSVRDGAYRFSSADLETMLSEWSAFSEYVRIVNLSGVGNSFSVTWLHRLGQFSRLAGIALDVGRRGPRREDFAKLPANWPSSLRAFPNLTSLTLRGITDWEADWNQEEFEQELLKVLAELPIRRLALGPGVEFSPTNGAVANLRTALSSVVRLELHDSPRDNLSDDPSFELLRTLAACSRLKELVLTRWYLNDEAIRHLLGFKSLELLQLDGCELEPDALLTLVGGFHGVLRLDRPRLETR